MTGPTEVQPSSAEDLSAQTRTTESPTGEDVTAQTQATLPSAQDVTTQTLATRQLVQSLLADPEARAGYEDVTDRISLIERARRLRKTKRLRQGEVAAMMGTTQSAVSDLEAGRVEPQLRTFQRYIRALGGRLELSMATEDAQEQLRRRAFGSIIMTLVTEPPSLRTASAMATKTQWPQTIVQPILSSLLTEGWARRSRDRQIYSLDKKAGRIIGLYLRRDSVTAVLQNLGGDTLWSLHERTRSSRRQDVVELAGQLVERLIAFEAPGQIVGVGVTLAGVVDPWTGRIAFAPDMEDEVDKWRGVPLQELLEAELRSRLPDQFVPVAVENDANALAVQEYLRREGKCVATLVLSGEGVGVGAVMTTNGNAEVYYGAHARAGEGGHLIVVPDGTPCRAGFPHKGCLETEASTQGILSHLGYASTGGPTTPRKLDKGLALANERVEEGDEKALGAFRDAGRYIGRFLVATRAFLDPDLIVISAHRFFVHEKEYQCGAVFREGVQAGLNEGALGDDVDPPNQRPRIEWHPLEELTFACAAGRAALRYFLTHPAKLAPSLVDALT